MHRPASPMGRPHDGQFRPASRGAVLAFLFLGSFTSCCALPCRAVAHSLLERVDRYLWSPRPSTLGPHIYSTFNTEKAAENAVKVHEWCVCACLRPNDLTRHHDPIITQGLRPSCMYIRSYVCASANFMSEQN